MNTSEDNLIVPNMDRGYLEKVYSFYASFYDHIFGEIMDPGRKTCVDLLRLGPNSRVLDVGVGTGIMLPHYPRSWNLTGIDISPKMIEQAKKRAGELGWDNLNLEVMDATQLPFAESSFDAVVASYTLNAVPEPRKVLENIKRVLKPNGKLVVINRRRGRTRWFREMEERFSFLFEKIGFSVCMDMPVFLQENGMKIHEIAEVPGMGQTNVIVAVKREGKETDRSLN